MAVRLEDVEYAAKLARLQFNQNERGKIIEDLDNILKFVHNLSEINTDNVHISIGAYKQFNVLREDIVQPSLVREELLKGAPEEQNGYIKVPRVIG